MEGIMFKSKNLIFTFFVLISFFSSSLLLAEGVLGDKISANANISYLSDYVFRGTLCDDKEVIQKNFGVSLYNFSASVWANQPLKDRTSYSPTEDEYTLNSDEVDYTLDYAFSLNKLNFNMGIVRYTYPDMSLNMNEVYASCAYKFIVTPKILFANDCTNGGNYLELDLAYSKDIIENLSTDLGATFGFYDNYAANYAGYKDFRAALNLKLSEKISLSPNLHYVIIDRDLKENAEGNGRDDDKLYGGVSLNLSI
jgi:hypothetical protein